METRFGGSEKCELVFSVGWGDYRQVKRSVTPQPFVWRRAVLLLCVSS